MSFLGCDHDRPAIPYEGPEMIPVLNLLESEARAMSAKPGWPNNPPQVGTYIFTRDTRRSFHVPAELGETVNDEAHRPHLRAAPSAVSRGDGASTA